MRRWWPLLISLFSLFLILETLNQFGVLNTQLIPPTSLVFKTFWNERELFVGGFLQTLINVSVGLFLSLTFGLLISFIFSLFSFFRRALFPLSVFFQTVPIIALAPLLVIYFGFGDATVVASSMIVSLFPIIANTLSGLDQGSQEQLDLFQIYNASSLQILFKLKIPGSYDSIFAGLKIASGLAIIGAVAGEFVAGGGLGAIIDSARTQQRVDQVFVSLYLLSFMGIMLLGITEGINLAIKNFRPYGRTLEKVRYK